MSAGKSLTHDSAALHVSGAAIYVDDIESTGSSLHLAIGWSDFEGGVL